MTLPLFILRRVVSLITTLLITSVVIFGALQIAPGDPAAALAGGSRPDPATLAQIRAAYHLSDPFWSQYWHWLSHLLTGHLGQSIVFRSPVSALLAGRAVNTLILVVYAGAVIVLVGVALGALAALRGRRANALVTVGTTVGMAVPTFVMAIVLIWVFATKLTWFPIYGSGSGFADKLRHLTLPALALSFSFVAYVARVTRTSVAAELHSEHVDMARGRGLPPLAVVRRHVLRNAAGPILTVSGLAVAGLIAGDAVAEQAFGVNGLGSLLIESAARKDLAVVQILSMFMVGAFVLINTIVDIAGAALDPRLARAGEGGQ